MALNQKANTQTADFEAPDDDTVGNEQDQAAAIRAKAQERLTAAATAHQATKPAENAVATAKPQGGQVALRKALVNPLAPLKGAFTVEWDTLRSLKVTNGNVLDNQSGKTLGDVVGLELLSFQDQWVISPGVDGDEAKEHVRYSNDGETTTNGEDCNEYLEQLKKADFPDAKMSKRTVICGSLFDIGDKGRKDCKDIQDCLVQLSLAPTSKASFDRYMMDQAFKIGKALISPEGAERLKLECTVVTKGKNSWTVVNFSRYDA